MEKYQTPNVGKICSIEIINVADVDEVRYDIDYQQIKITEKSGKIFTNLVFTDESAKLNIVEEGDDDGSTQFKHISLEFQIPQITSTRTASIEKWKRQMIICCVTDVNGREFVIGTLKSPAVITYTGSIAQNAAGDNLYTVTINGYSSHGLLQRVI